MVVSPQRSETTQLAFVLSEKQRHNLKARLLDWSERGGANPVAQMLVNIDAEKVKAVDPKDHEQLSVRFYSNMR